MKNLLLVIFILIFPIQGQSQDSGNCRKSKILRTNFCIGDYVKQTLDSDENLVGQVIGVVESPEHKYHVVTLLASDWELPILKRTRPGEKGGWNVQTTDLSDLEIMMKNSSFGGARIMDFEEFRTNWRSEIQKRIEIYKSKAQKNGISVKIKFP